MEDSQSDNLDLSASDVMRGLLATQYYFLASIVVLYYDYFLTFEMEVQRFWTQRTLSWASFFFYVNRYLSLLGHVIVATEYFSNDLSDSANSCQLLHTYHQYFAIATQLIVGVLLMMRVYALYNQNRGILVFMCTVAACVVAFGLWVIMTGKKNTTAPAPISGMGCSEPLSKEVALRFTAAWSGLLVSDIILFGITVAKAITVGRMGDRALINVLLRDGAMYFLIICLANLANILTLVLGGPIIRGMGTSFTNVISVVMISRLMLNLRSPSLTRRKPLSGTFSNTGSLTDRPCVSTVVDGFPCDTNIDMYMEYPHPTPAKHLRQDSGTSDIELVTRNVA